MENAFLYRYLKYMKEDLKCLEKEENRGKYNFVSAIVQNGGAQSIYNDIEVQKEALSDMNELVVNLRAAKQKRLDGRTDEENKVYKLGVSITRKLSKYEKNLERMAQYMIHYNAVMKNWDCSFAIIFTNGEVWSVNYTRSLRKDRIDTHMARFDYLHSDKNFLVIPNYEEQDSLSKALVRKLKDNPTEYGTPIIIVSFEELLDKVMENIFSCKRKDGKLVKLPTNSMLSIVNGMRGVEVEKIYSKCLSNVSNFNAYLEDVTNWKKEETDGTFLPSEFGMILDKILNDKGINKADVERIEAIDIGDLQLKPDVYIYIYLKNQTLNPIEIGISIKSSGGDSVSFHEKKAEDFIRELEIDNNDVKEALNRFQQLKAAKHLTNAEKRCLSEYFSDETNRKRLVTWAATGAETDQYRAHYILTHRYGNDGDSLGINIVHVNDYIEKFMSEGPTKAFNSGFSWTYRSVIQLKGPVFWGEES